MQQTRSRLGPRFHMHPPDHRSQRPRLRNPTIRTQRRRVLKFSSLSKSIPEFLILDDYTIITSVLFWLPDNAGTARARFSALGLSARWRAPAGSASELYVPYHGGRVPLRGAFGLYPCGLPPACALSRWPNRVNHGLCHSPCPWSGFPGPRPGLPPRPKSGKASPLLAAKYATCMEGLTRASAVPFDAAERCHCRE